MESSSSEEAHPKTSIWLRGLAMIFLGMIFQVCETILFMLAIVQFFISLANHSANARLSVFGSNLSIYVSQLAAYLTFASDTLPFPFGDWPAADRKTDFHS